MSNELLYERPDGPDQCFLISDEFIYEPLPNEFQPTNGCSSIDHINFVLKPMASLYALNLPKRLTALSFLPTLCLQPQSQLSILFCDQQKNPVEVTIC